MSTRGRTYVAVAVAAACAVALVVGTVAFTRTSTGGGGSPPSRARGRSGAPPLLLDLGVRDDAAAQALRRASSLYASRRLAQAGRIFRSYRSPQAQVGAAFAAWPDGAVARLQRLARAHPGNAFVQLHLGLALLWRGETAAAEAAWRAAATREPDSASAVHAEDLLHPGFAPGLPEFVPSGPYPRGLAGLSPPRQLAALARAAPGGARARILYGVALQRLGRPISAERQFAAAAALAPGNPEALAAAAVGRFSKSDPSAAFSRLGPLARRFPHAQTVRFHLGLLLLYIRQVGAARRELQLARAEGPRTVIGRTANAFLQRLRGVRTG
jgi:predicted Zn-dependent protease